MELLKLMFSNTQLCRVTYFNFSASFYPFWEFCPFLLIEKREITTETHLHFLSKYMLSKYIWKGRQSECDFPPCSHSSQVLSGSQVFGLLPLLCRWAAFGISCPWSMTSRLTTSMRLLAWHVHVLSENSHPFW